MRRSFLLLAGLALAASAAAAQNAPRALSLREAVALALDESPQMAAAEARADQAAARVTQARSTWLPQIQLSETWTEGDNPVYVFGSLLEQGKFGPQHFDPVFLNDPPSFENYRTALSLRAPVFDQFRRISRIGQAHLGARGARAGLTGTRQQMIFETLRLYDGVALAEQQKRVAEETVRTAEADVAKIRDLAETGLVVQSDLLAGEVQLAEFQQRLIEAEGNVAIARAALAAALGLSAAEPLELTSALGAPPADELPLADLIAGASQNRPDLVGSDVAQRAARLETRIARGSWLPRLDAFATFGASGASVGDQDGDALYGAVVTLDILQPGRQGRVAEARAGERAAEAEAERLRRNAEVEILSAHYRLTTARQSLDVAERNVARAEETFRIVRDRYAAGLTTITEQLRAQTALLGARLNLLAARSAARVGYAGVLLASGRLESIDSVLGGTQ
ncbi:MAG TPA: TolC family protein [Thermoanaerobaculia bacterium]